MDTKEIERLAKFLARANPPPILYRYRRPTDWTLEEISKQQIYVAKPDELNDPFECSAPIFWDGNSLRRRFIEEYAPSRGLTAVEAASQFDLHSEEIISGLRRDTPALIKAQCGIICFTAFPNSIRMWSYYAQAHEGICVGFDTKVRPFMLAIKVTYQNPDIPLNAVVALKRDPTEVAGHVTLRKADEWEFEQEYRIPISPMKNNPRLIQFHPSAIKEVRFGTRIQHEFREKVMEAISYLPHRPKLIQMGCDFDRFILTETII